MRHIIAVSVSAALLAACGSQPPAPEQSPSGVESRTPSAVTTAPVAPTSPTATPFDPMSPKLITDPRSPLSKRDVYFDYDSYVIRADAQSLLTTHAKFLAAQPQMKLLVQGHADERGSREYNLALGQKRAEAVKKALGLLGVGEARIEAVSLGEEKPACTQADEACWAQNRRGHLLYSGEF